MACGLAICCASLTCYSQGERPKPVQNAHWVLEYDESIPHAQQHGSSERSIWKDSRFPNLLKASFKDQPDVWKEVTQSYQLTSGGVKVLNGRYAVIDGCPVHECGIDNWLLWIDTQSDFPDVLYASLTVIDNDPTDATYSLTIVDGEPHRKTMSLATLPKGFWDTLQAWFSEKASFDDGFFAGYEKRRIVAASFNGPNHKSIPLPAGSLRPFNVSDSSSK
jgi:hypothetical protein